MTDTVLPRRAQELLDAANLAILTTLNADGSPHTAPVWVLRDGEEILLSTLASRQKAHNIDRDPRVSLIVLDPRERTSYVSVNGRVASVTPDQDRELLQRLSWKYLGTPYPRAEGPERIRVVVRITPERVSVR